VNENDWVYVADTGNDRIVRYNADGTGGATALGLSLVGMMICFSTVRLAGPGGMAEAQMAYLWSTKVNGVFDLGLPQWGIFLQPLGFLLFFAASFAETKRAPFDTPEGESEIVGYFLEYSGMQFGLFMISEFVEVVVLSGVLVTIFFGAWWLPFGNEWLLAQNIPGLLMGAMITQHPDLCKAVVSSVGIYDMLRVELSPNGAFNITEFGTVKNPEQFRALLAYSPLHNVKDGTRYPAVLFMTGANDPRVDPMQSRKMAARLQAADPAGLFLLRTSSNTGHGMGTPLAERIEQTVDQYAFLFEQLGVKYKPMVGK